jgi:hypothetical protein
MISLASWPVPLLALVVLGEPHQCWRYLVSECFRVFERRRDGDGHHAAELTLITLPSKSLKITKIPQSERFTSFCLR